MEDNKLYEKNMRKIFFLDLAIENYEDNTGKNIKNLEKTFNELKHLRKENENMNKKEKIELSKKILKEFENAIEEIGKSKFKFYSDGKIEYLWNESSEREEK